jgi:hypothetical protein
LRRYRDLRDHENEAAHLTYFSEEFDLCAASIANAHFICVSRRWFRDAARTCEHHSDFAQPLSGIGNRMIAVPQTPLTPTSTGECGMLTRHQVVLLVTLVLSSQVCASAASAQDQSKRPPETTGSASTLPSGVPEAPVGHRQPRASDVPSDTRRTNEEETQIQRDRELDKQLWICRGCGEPL